MYSWWNSTSRTANVAAYFAMQGKAYMGYVHDLNGHKSIVRLNILKNVQKSWVHIVFAIIAMILLFFLRRGDRAIRNEFSSAYVDVMITITGAGRLRYRDKLEKIFFGILFLGSFYINTIEIDNAFFTEFVTQFPERFDTLAKLKQINASIRSIDLGEDHPVIKHLM